MQELIREAIKKCPKALKALNEATEKLKNLQKLKEASFKAFQEVQEAGVNFKEDRRMIRGVEVTRRIQINAQEAGELFSQFQRLDIEIDKQQIEIERCVLELEIASRPYLTKAKEEFDAKVLALQASAAKLAEEAETIWRAFGSTGIDVGGTKFQHYNYIAGGLLRFAESPLTGPSPLKAEAA